MDEENPMQAMYNLRAKGYIDHIHDQIGKEVPLVLSDHKHEEDYGSINSEETESLFKYNINLANTKEIDTNKKRRSNYKYITDLWLRGIKIIKRYK
jgi:hypothetical protein